MSFLVDAGKTVITVGHDMDVIAASDWIVVEGPGARKDGGKIVAERTLEKVSKNRNSKTAKYLKGYI